MCTAENEVVYQAKFLPSYSRMALEICNTTHLWILTKPIIAIDEQFYQVDPYCSMIVNELGSTSHGSSPSTEATLFLGMSVIELASITGVGTMLVLVIVLVIFLVSYCVYKRKVVKSYNVR